VVDEDMVTRKQHGGDAEISTDCYCSCSCMSILKRLPDQFRGHPVQSLIESHGTVHSEIRF